MEMDMQIQILQIDAETGLPPAKDSIENEKKYLESISFSVNLALEKFREANLKTRFKCDDTFLVEIDNDINTTLAKLKILSLYRDCVQQILDCINHGDWEQAFEQLTLFITHHPDETECDFKLLAALKTGVEVNKTLHNMEDRNRLRYLRRIDL